MNLAAAASDITHSKIWRQLAALTLAAVWAASPAYAQECDTRGSDPIISSVLSPDPVSDSDCRIDVSGPSEAPPTVHAVATSGIFMSPTNAVYLDVCGAWPLVRMNTQITFAELEFYSYDPGTPSTVLTLTAARINGIPSLVVDVVDKVSRGWSLANSVNQLPPVPAATWRLTDCKADISSPFDGAPVEIRLVNNSRIEVTQNGDRVMNWPRSSAFLSNAAVTRYPGQIRVMPLRHENASASTVARTRWSFAPR